MSKRHNLFTVLPAALMILQAVRPAAGQVLFGSIVGSVTDASGAADPGASVTVTQLETNESRETVTADTGSFSLPTVRPGTYKISIRKLGFKVYFFDDVPVTLNTVVRADAALQLGAQNESVEVTSVSAP